MGLSVVLPSSAPVEVPSSAPVEVTDTAMEISSDYRCCLRAAYIHTRAVEPLVPYVDNIHEVIKKPFVAKGPNSSP